MAPSEWQLEEILPLDALPEHATDAQQRFYALAFAAKHGSAVMKCLTTQYATLLSMGFGHLKRMKKHPTAKNHLLALIRPVDDNEDEENDNTQEFQTLQQQFDAQVTCVHVLKYAPRTREAWEEHTQSWPLIFHASVYQGPQVEAMDDDQVNKMTKFLQMAMDNAADSTEKTCCSRVCLIVDASTERIVATSFSTEEEIEFSILWHPIMRAIEAVAARDRQRNEEIQQRKKQKTTKDHTKQEDHQEVESYLCTGYDVYVDQEPCVMCAMALVHSRARRVTFHHRNTKDGALVSNMRLHTIKSLNHHYRVFQLTNCK